MLPIIDPNQPIAIDIETCDPELHSTAPGFISNVGFIAGIAIAAKEGSWYIPIHHKKGKNYDEKEVVAWLNEICSADTEKIFHNAQYDVGWLKHLGVELHGKLFDTMLAAPLLNENRFSYTLDSLGKIYCNEGKYEEALKMAVAEEFDKVKTRKTIIRLKENSECNDYKPFINAKKRVSQFFDIWPEEVKQRYEVLGYEISKNGQELFVVPCRRQKDIKSLLWAVDAEDMGTYPIQDVELTYKLYHIFKKELQKEQLVSLFDMESELTLPLMEMRSRGVRIDMKKAIELDKKYSQQLETNQLTLDSIVGFPVNVNAESDLVKICHKFGLEYTLTEKGNPCFSSEMIPKDDLGIFNLVLDIRTYMKARDTYIRGYIFGKTIDGWLHGQYNQLKSDDGGTITGRLSSSDPNMQNLPNPKLSEIGKEIRSLFIPDTNDERWLSLDYSGQEPKMLVHVILKFNAQQEKIARGESLEEYVPGASLAKTEKFSGRNADFHTAVSEICMRKEYMLYGKNPEGDDFKKDVKAFRQKAKSIGLGVMYGSGNKKVAEEMTKKRFPMTTEEAKDIRLNIYEGVPFLKFASDTFMNLASSRGYIKTILGRRGRFDTWECPIRNDKIAKKLNFANMGFQNKKDAMDWYNQHKEELQSDLEMPRRARTYKALNKFIQGSSADQTKTAMVHLYKRGDLTLNALDIFYRRIGIEPPNFKTQVHDEINVSIKNGEDPKWYQDIMEHCLPLMVEVVADPVVCNKWSEAK